MIVNKKRVFRLMKEHQLLVSPDTKLRAKRAVERFATPQSHPFRGGLGGLELVNSLNPRRISFIYEGVLQRPKPRARKPDEIYGIDMTKIKLREQGWAYLVLVIDWYTKNIVGYTVDTRSKNSHWLLALNQAACLQCPEGTRGKGIKLVSDNGCQPTSTCFMGAAAAMGIEQIFTSYNNPKGNADTERVFRTLKEEIVWTREYEGLEQLKKTIEQWVYYYNTSYLHSALGYKPPVCFEEECKRKAA